MTFAKPTTPYCCFPDSTKRSNFSSLSTKPSSTNDMMQRQATLASIPVLNDDETLYSWCAMAHALNPGRSVLATSVALFGSPNAGRLHDFPSHLSALASRFQGVLPDSRRLALRHTLVGFFLPLQTPSTAGAILSELCAGAMPSIKMRLGITASRIGSYHPLKSCDSCIQSDRARTGVAYWHIEHQWPSVAVCSKHELPLVMTWHPITPVHRREWLLPGNTDVTSLIEMPVLDDGQLVRLLQLAEFSTHMALSEPAAFDCTRLARTYQERLRTLGLASVRGNLRLKLLLEVVRSRYRGIDAVPGFEPLQAISPDWPGLVGALSRRVPRSGHPLKHLLMIAMLFDSWPEFLAAYSVTANPPPSS